MQKFFLIFTLSICLIYSHNKESKVWNNSKPAVAYDLKEFEEFAEEFTEQFTSDAFDIELILGSDYEFLENSFPAQPLQVPTLTQNHTAYTSLLMPVCINQKAFYQKADRLPITISDYSLILPSIFYHPPQV
jgi:hypothetical protein